MSTDRRAMWDARFAERPDAPGAPEPWVVARLARLPAAPDGGGARVLDLACGDGRNAVWAAARGLRVTAADHSTVGLERARRFAARAGAALDTRLVDLEAPGALAGLGPFEAIVVCHYKPPGAVWAALPGLLAPGGVVIAVTFNEEEHAASGFSRRFCVERGEWRALPGLVAREEVRYVEGGRNLDGYVLVGA